MKYYSQYKQDFFVDKILSKRNGIFVDIGANGGIIDSNSYFLEKYKNWTGVCIEPINEKFEILNQIRNAKCYNIGIFKEDTNVDFFQVKGYAEMLSGIVNSFQKVHFERLQNEIKLHGGEIEIINIEVRNINKIFVENKIFKIDYFSIDTEGSEFEILTSIEFENCDISLISIENNYNDSRINDFLTKNNYTLVKKLGNDEIYISNKIYKKIHIKLNLILFNIDQFIKDKKNKILKRIKYSIFNRFYLQWNNKKLLIRENTTDSEVFDYVFIEKYHRPSFEIAKKPIILDLGANVGFSAIDLKKRYPQSKIFCYEMDEGNYKSLILNTNKCKNIYSYNKAVWIKNEIVNYDNSSPNDSYHIDNSNKLSKSVIGITIESIFNENQLQFVDFIKMDIEGAEIDIFKSDLNWLKKIKSIKVEVHNKEHFDFIFSQLIINGFNTWKDSNHWSTICAFRK